MGVSLFVTLRRLSPSVATGEAPVNYWKNLVPHSDILPRSFYDRDVQLVASELLGKLLARRSRAGLCVGRIVETEAYLAEGDPACHCVKGKTKSNGTMFGKPGFAYVYPIHGRYCMNVVTEAAGRASAVLIRAVEPLVGVGIMQRRRHTEKMTDLCRGPARLCEAFDVDRGLDGWDMTRGQRSWIADNPAWDTGAANISHSPRIGVSSAKEFELRFFLDCSPFVSGPKRLSTRVG